MGGMSDRAAPTPLTPRYIVTGTAAAAISGFAVALYELARDSGFREDAWGQDVVEAVILGFTVAVVFTMVGVGVLLLSQRVALPTRAGRRAVAVGMLVAAVTPVLGLLVLAVHPELWPDWPLVLIPACVGGLVSGVSVLREGSR